MSSGLRLHERGYRFLQNAEDWVTACPEADVSVCGVILAAGSEVMLRLWESRYTRDDSMFRVVDAMRRWAAEPSVERQEEVAAANRRGSVTDDSPWLCIPWEMPRRIGSDTPADFAGDAIVWAAKALTEAGTVAEFRPALKEALDLALEAIARQLDEHSPDETTDYWRQAHSELRDEILAFLDRAKGRDGLRSREEPESGH